MSAEFHVRFEDLNWYLRHRGETEERLQSLSSCIRSLDGEYRLKSPANREPVEGDWCYDVRIRFLDREIFLEISSHPLAVERDIGAFLKWLSAQTFIRVLDDDDEDVDLIPPNR